MKILATLIEEGRNPFKGNRISLDEAAGFVARECRQSLKAPPIFTNGAGRFDAFVVHPTGRRPQNVMEVLFDDVLESWSTYPKRTQSLVGSGRGGDFRVFPIDGANVAFTTRDTFNEAFDTAYSKFGDPDVGLQNLMQIITNAYNMRMGKSKVIPESINGSKLKEFFQWSNELWGDSKNRNINRILTAAGADESERMRIRTILDLGERDIGRGLDLMFSPEFTDIETRPLTQLPQGAGEVWTDSPAVLVRTDKLGAM